MKHFLIILLVLTTILSCKSKATNTKPAFVEYIGELRFRKTYADIQFMNNEKETDEYLAKQSNSNPILLTDTADPIFFIADRLNQLGLLRKDTRNIYELLLPKFNFQTEDSSSFHTSSETKYKLKFYTDSSGGTTLLKLISTKDSIIIDTKSTPLQDLNYTFLDVIPGGNKELVFLHDYYIMNGDNFDLKLYIIK